MRVSFTTSPVAVSSIANVCWRACKSHPIIRISASFDPSTVGVNTDSLLGPSRGRRRYDINQDVQTVCYGIRQESESSFAEQLNDKND